MTWDVQGFLNLHLMLIDDSLKDWCSSQYSKTPFLFVLGQILQGSCAVLQSLIFIFEK